MRATPTRSRTRTWLAWLLGAAIASASAIGDGRVAWADDIDTRVAQLGEQLDAKRSEKERIAAVTALGRLEDKRTLKPLVAALRDRSPTVRAVAALALGKLGHRAALPALREASKDEDELVRKRAADAVTAVNAANGIEDEPAAKPTKATKGKAKAGFGNQPRALEVRPEVFVTVKSSSDDSPGKLDKKSRKAHADIAKQAMSGELAASALVTTAAKTASRYGLDTRNIDVIITGLELRTAGSYIEVEAQLRLAISDHRGKMLSFLTGGAKVQVKKASFDMKYLPQLRREAIENAVKGIFDKLLAHLRRGAGA